MAVVRPPMTFDANLISL